VLDGGFNAWREAGGAVEDLPPHVMADRHFTVRPRQDLVRSLEQMKDLVGGAAQVVDARSGPRFRGEIEEPRPGLRRGHMPGALNVYYGDLIGADGRLKPEPEMRAIFEKASVDLARPIVNTCGSGVTAAILALAQSMLGRDDAAVYDGSWAEWGAPKSGGAVETG
jgi:thiosulfate/3-mercaptopyruvate sulfurtransferase